MIRAQLLKIGCASGDQFSLSLHLFRNIGPIRADIKDIEHISPTLAEFSSICAADRGMKILAGLVFVVAIVFIVCGWHGRGWVDSAIAELWEAIAEVPVRVVDASLPVFSARIVGGRGS
jgi:hypothetical protein